MSLLGTFAQRSTLENPEIPISSSSAGQLFGGTETSAGVLVSEETAFGITAYYRAIALISGTIAGLPLKTYRNGTREPAGFKTVLDAPNPRHNYPFVFWQTVIANAVSWGRLTCWKRTNSAGVVSQLWPIHPSRCIPFEVPESAANPQGLAFRVTHEDGRITVHTSAEILHIPYLSVNGITGISPLQAARDALGTGIAAERSAGKFYKNGSQVSGALSTDQDLTKPQADFIREEWQDIHAGPENAHRIAILSNGAKFNGISIPPKDAELLASRKWTVTEIARMFGLPPHLLGDIEKSSSWGTGIEQQNLGLVVFTLKPWLDLVEQALSANVLNTADIYAEYSVEGLLRGDSKSRSEFYAKAIQWGWMNRNEVRQLENREPVDGLDDHLTPLNMSGAMGDEDDVRSMAEIVQKLYLGVGTLITEEEARQLLVDAGFDIDPTESPSGGPDADS